MTGAIKSFRIKLSASMSVVLLVTLFVSFVGARAASASGATVTISGSMEGNLPVHPNDTLQAGFDITMPGSHPAADIHETGGTVTLQPVCPNGISPNPSTLVIQIPAESFSIPANSSAWFPSGDQSSPLVYQGSLTAPAACGSGVTYHVPGGATFSASFTSNDISNPVHLRFHYRDNTSGSWSGTVSFTPPFAPAIFLAYYDSYRPSNVAPSPWQGSPGVNFLGAPDTRNSYDSGVIRLDNASGTAITVDSATVDIGGCQFHPWSGTTLSLPASIPAHGSLILTQTGDPSLAPWGNQPSCTSAGPTDTTENFDTSESVPGTATGGDLCQPDGLVPMVNLTISGAATTYLDSTQVLNTGGFDLGCLTNESTTGWTQIN